MSTNLKNWIARKPSWQIVGKTVCKAFFITVATNLNSIIEIQDLCFFINFFLPDLDFDPKTFDMLILKNQYESQILKVSINL